MPGLPECEYHVCITSVCVNNDLEHLLLPLGVNNADSYGRPPINLIGTLSKYNSGAVDPCN